MPFDPVTLLNVTSTVLLGSTGAFIFLGLNNLKRRDRTNDTGGEKRELDVSDSLQEIVKGQVHWSPWRANNVPSLAPRRLVEDDSLTQAAADIGVANLETLLREIIKSTEDPPHLVGINKGGSLVANFLVHRLAMHEKYLIKCDFRPDFDKIYCEHRPELKNVIIVDDVVRSGRTISRVREYFKSKYPRSHIFTMCLVYVGKDSENDEPSQVVDYHAWHAKSSHIVLPWSKREVSDVSQIFDDHEISQISGVSPSVRSGD